MVDVSTEYRIDLNFGDFDHVYISFQDLEDIVGGFKRASESPKLVEGVNKRVICIGYHGGSFRFEVFDTNEKRETKSEVYTY